MFLRGNKIGFYGFFLLLLFKFNLLVSIFFSLQSENRVPIYSFVVVMAILDCQLNITREKKP